MARLSQAFTTILLILVGIVVFTISLPFFIISLPFIWINELRFHKGYTRYINSLEGKNFFCYNNKATSKLFIEQEIIPNLPDSIEIIYLNGRTPESNYEKKYISRILYQFKNYQGFPQLLKIRNNKLIDASIRGDVFNSINQNKAPEKLFRKLLDFYEIQDTKHHK